MSWLWRSGGQPKGVSRSSVEESHEQLDVTDRGGRSLPVHLGEMEAKEDRKGASRQSWQQGDAGGSLSSYLVKATSPKSKGKTKATTMSSVEAVDKDVKTRRRAKTHGGDLTDISQDIFFSTRSSTPRGRTRGSSFNVDSNSQADGDKKTSAGEESFQRPRPASSSAALSTNLLAQVLGRRKKKGDEVAAFPTALEATAAAETSAANRTANKVGQESQDQVVSNARLLLDEQRLQETLQGESASKHAERRSEALRRSKRLKEMMAEGPQMTQMRSLRSNRSGQVDVSKFDDQKQSQEDLYWQTLWNATKDMMRAHEDEDDEEMQNTVDFDGLLPGVPGSMELPMP